MSLFITACDGYTYFRIGTLRVLLFADGDIYTSRCDVITADDSNRNLWDADPLFVGGPQDGAQ